MGYIKGKKLFEGKTKAGFSVEYGSHLVWFKNKNDITKDDDKTLTEEMASKAEYSTNTTSKMFELLRSAGIPVAFKEQVSETEFVAEKCQMIPLEIVCRRNAVGSYLKRNPHLDMGDKVPPHRFHSLKFELFLKTTDLKIINYGGNHIGDTVVEDPFIKDPYNDLWELYHPKLPVWDAKANLNNASGINHFFPSVGHCRNHTYVGQIEGLARKTFLVIEGAWAQYGFHLIDLKIEVGITETGELVVADVIDNDSWRLRTQDWKELSKQLFRDNYSMKDISSAYALVSEMVNRFSIPKQVIVLWRGCEKDGFPDVSEVAGVNVEEITLSGHKRTDECLKALERTLMQYPQGGVMITSVGMSNGLGPILVSHTNLPVISYPASEEKWQQVDVWSSLRAPSQVPLMTVINPKNAVLAALNILAQSNPAAYMERQYAIEMLDSGY